MIDVGIGAGVEKMSAAGGTTGKNLMKEEAKEKPKEKPKVAHKEQPRDKPSPSTSSAMMLVEPSPQPGAGALNWVTDTTAPSSGSAFRETRDWSAVTTWAPHSSGSTPRWGMAAWPPLPEILIVKLSSLPMRGPARTPTCPTGMPGQLCSPYPRSCTRAGRARALVRLSAGRTTMLSP